jgi:DNA-binding MarR family transcriptional regulator
MRPVSFRENVLQNLLLQLKPNELIVYLALYIEPGPLSIKEIVECTSISRPTVQHSLDRLERRGFVEKIPTTLPCLYIAVEN